MGRRISRVRYDFLPGLTKIRVFSESRRGTPYTIDSVVVAQGAKGKREYREARRLGLVNLLGEKAQQKVL